MKSRLNGARYQMMNFNFFYGISLAREILMITDNLAKALQKHGLSALEGKELYKLTSQTLANMMANGFEKFWQTTLKMSEDLELSKPELKRKTKKPAKFVDSSDSEEEEIVDDIKEHYKRIYNEAFDIIIKNLKQRFEQKNLKHYEDLQELLLLAANHEDYSERLNLVIEQYNDDFDANTLKSQMKIFSNMFPVDKKTSYDDLIAHFMQLKPEMKTFISEVCKVMELIMVLPASNAGAERSFSRMKNVKTRLRTRMKAKRLNHFMIMGIYKDKVDKLDLEKIAEKFIKRNENQQKVFRKIGWQRQRKENQEKV